MTLTGWACVCGGGLIFTFLSHKINKNENTIKVKQSRYRPGVAQRVPGKAVPLQAWSGPEGSR